MRVILNRPIHGAIGSFAEGEEVNLPDDMAQALIEAKAASAVEPQKKKREYARKPRPNAELRKAAE